MPVIIEFEDFLIVLTIACSCFQFDFFVDILPTNVFRKCPKSKLSLWEQFQAFPEPAIGAFENKVVDFSLAFLSSETYKTLKCFQH